MLDASIWLDLLWKYQICWLQEKIYKDIPLIWDTRALFGLTPFRGYFIDYVDAVIPVKDVTKVNRVIGIGTAIQNMIDVNDQVFYLPCVYYHLLTNAVQLLSPQTYYQMHGGSSAVFIYQLIMKLPNNCIEIPINVQGVNLMILENSCLTAKDKDLYGP